MEATTANDQAQFTGSWIMNKTLSGDFDKILSMQNVDWIKRKVLSMVSINLDIGQSCDNGLTRINIGQRAGSIKGDQDCRVLDQTQQHKTDELFGDVISCSRWIKINEVQNEFLRQGWPQNQSKSPNAEVLVQTVVHGKDWVATEILGLGQEEGEKILVRRIVLTKGKEQESIVLVYNFTSAVPV